MIVFNSQPPKDRPKLRSWLAAWRFADLSSSNKGSRNGDVPNRKASRNGDLSGSNLQASDLGSLLVRTYFEVAKRGGGEGFVLFLREEVMALLPLCARREGGWAVWSLASAPTYGGRRKMGREEIRRGVVFDVQVLARLMEVCGRDARQAGKEILQECIMLCQKGREGLRGKDELTDALANLAQSLWRQLLQPIVPSSHAPDKTKYLEQDRDVAELALRAILTFNSPSSALLKIHTYLSSLIQHYQQHPTPLLHFPLSAFLRQLLPLLASLSQPSPLLSTSPKQTPHASPAHTDTKQDTIPHSPLHRLAPREPPATHCALAVDQQTDPIRTAKSSSEDQSSAKSDRRSPAESMKRPCAAISGTSLSRASADQSSAALEQGSSWILEETLRERGGRQGPVMLVVTKLLRLLSLLRTVDEGKGGGQGGKEDRGNEEGDNKVGESEGAQEERRERKGTVDEDGLGWVDDLLAEEDKAEEDAEEGKEGQGGDGGGDALSAPLLAGGVGVPIAEQGLKGEDYQSGDEHIDIKPCNASVPASPPPHQHTPLPSTTAPSHYSQAAQDQEQQQEQPQEQSPLAAAHSHIPHSVEETQEQELVTLAYQLALPGLRDPALSIRPLALELLALLHQQYPPHTLPLRLETRTISRSNFYRGPSRTLSRSHVGSPRSPHLLPTLLLMSIHPKAVLSSPFSHTPAHSRHLFDYLLGQYSPSNSSFSSSLSNRSASSTSPATQLPRAGKEGNREGIAEGDKSLSGRKEAQTGEVEWVRGLCQETVRGCLEGLAEAEEGAAERLLQECLGESEGLEGRVGDLGRRAWCDMGVCGVWALWEMARILACNRLKSHLGGPGATFAGLERALVKMKIELKGGEGCGEGLQRRVEGMFVFLEALERFVAMAVEVGSVYMCVFVYGSVCVYVSMYVCVRVHL